MKYIYILLLSVASLELRAQDIRHEFTSPEDSVKLHGLKLYLEIDSVYEVSDSSGVKFSLEMVNEGDKTLRLTNPLYDTKLNINPSFWLLPSKERLELNEVFRWYSPRIIKKVKPYRLEKVIISGEKIPTNEYVNYWEIDTLSIKPGQLIRYELNLFERIVFDKEVRFKMYIKPLLKGEYYLIFDVIMKLSNTFVRSKPLRLRMKLK